MPWDEQEAAFQGSDREFLLWLYQEFSRLMFYTAQKVPGRSPQPGGGGSGEPEKAH